MCDEERDPTLPEWRDILSAGEIAELKKEYPSIKWISEL